MITWITSWETIKIPFHIINGIINKLIQINTTLPKLLCQKIGENNGKNAIDNKTPQNGIMLNKENSSPIETLEANIGEINKIIVINEYLNIYAYIFYFLIHNQDN